MDMYMRNLGKILILSSGVFLSINSIAGAGYYENVKATCYILKNNKLIKKTDCIYDGSIASTMQEHTSQVGSEINYKVQGYGRISVTAGSEVMNYPDERVIDSYTTLNGKKAVFQYRNQHLQLVPNKVAQKTNTKTLLECYKNPKLGFELCSKDK